MKGHGIDYQLRNMRLCAYYSGKPDLGSSLGADFCLKPATLVAIAKGGGDGFLCADHAEHVRECVECSTRIDRIVPVGR